MDINMKSKTNTKNGFTIVELLIVIVVIGILAAITIVAFNGIQDRARNTKTENAIAQYSKALITYATIHGQYPAGSVNSPCLGLASDYGANNCWGGTVDVSFNTTLEDHLGSGLPQIDTECQMMYGGCRRGAHLHKASTVPLDSQPHSWYIGYMLRGSGVPCTAARQAGGSWSSALSTPNSHQYIETHSGTTLCRVILPNPAEL